MKAWVWWAAGGAAAVGVAGVLLGLKGSGALEQAWEALPNPGGVLEPARRDPGAIFAAVARVNPAQNPTLQRGYLGQPNWCNRFVHLACDELGVPMIWGEYGTKADDQIAWLDAGSDGWFQVGNKSEAQNLALEGYVVLATYYNFLGSGHMALVLPLAGTMMIAQAGKSCFNQGTLAAGFGGINPVFYAHA